MPEARHTITFPLTFIVPRDSRDEFTFAKVQASVNDQLLTDEPEFLAALKRGLTNWAKETDEGKEAWERSSRDFNVGDLSCQLPDPMLEEYLHKEGIIAISVEPSCNKEQTRRWAYDTVLMDKDELKP